MRHRYFPRQQIMTPVDAVHGSPYAVVIVILFIYFSNVLSLIAELVKRLLKGKLNTYKSEAEVHVPDELSDVYYDYFIYVPLVQLL